MLSSESIHLKKIRSFILRQGRLTPGQQFALTHFWQRYGLDYINPFDITEAFGRQAPTVIEIGFGNGDSLAKMAAANPDTNYLGIEVHRPGVGHLLMELDRLALQNVRVFCHDAVEVIEHKIANDSLSGVHLFFPDPWPKKKHHKRRIVNAGFMRLLSNKLKLGGYFHAATDWQDYAESMLSVLSTETNFCNSSTTEGYCERPVYRPLTKFEQRGLRLGHRVWDLIFTRR